MINLFDTAQKLNNKLDVKGFTVYKGSLNGELVYIGTTVQKPRDRFRWHKSNGKNLQFEVIAQFDNEKEMLDLEFELIKKHNPRLNGIKHRRQNLNIKLSQSVIDLRVGDATWCQCCYKRRVNKGYSRCYYCN